MNIELATNIEENLSREEFFSISQEEFAKALGVVQDFTGNKLSQNFVGFSVDGGGLRILANNKGIDLILSLQTMVGETEKKDFITEIRPLKKVVSSLDLPEVRCRLSRNVNNINPAYNNGCFQIKSGKFSADLRAILSTSKIWSERIFNLFSRLKDEKHLEEEQRTLFFKMPVNDFLDASKKVVFVAPDHYIQPLSNVLFKIRNDHLILVANDGHRLSEKLTKGRGFLIGTDEETEILVPKIGLQKLRKLLEKTSQNENNQLDFYLDKEKRRIIFSFANYEMSCECSKGRYPDYKRLFPSRWRVKAILRTEEMVTAAEQASTLKPVRLEFDIENSRLNLTAENNEGETYKTSLAIEGKGKDTKIDLTPGYVLDFLRSIDSELVNITIAGSRRPVVFSPVGDEHYNHLIMPRSA